MTKYFITIAGNIGVGKSTLTKLLAQRLAWRPFYEGFAENPYLADFYGDMGRWAFHSQMFFLSQRLEQHGRLLQHQGTVIQDRSVYEDAEIFARNLYHQGHFSPRDWETYHQIYLTMTRLLYPPNLIVYLRASVPTLMTRIAQRGRDYERGINAQYLTNLNVLYDNWISEFNLCPVLTIETDKLNYVQYETHLDQIIDRIQERLRGKDVLTLGEESVNN